MSRCAVMGAGSWGTAFAMILADAGNDVTMWARRPEQAEQIRDRHRNPDYLSDVELPPSVTATADAREALDGADVVVLAVPSQHLRENLSGWVHDIPREAPVVSLMKGVELGTTQRMSQVIHEAGHIAPDRVVVVSGPNLAPEIAERQPAASVVACVDHDTADRVAHTCATSYFRPYTGTDVVGTELGGAVKNVIALAVGMAAGMGFGDNTKATIVTRGLAEMARLGEALGADPTTFAGLAGVGDLIATCLSPLSRNRTFGENLGRGMSVDEVIAATRQTAEGVKSCQSILDLAYANGVDMPITEGVVAVVHHGLSPQEMGRRLLSRARKPETD
ncbi:MAG TPA: NAD(P)H-dependent glycerol-3-phosphate dehydrogenase [Angustibacter sp.]|nr:NAD(P)H-dependent glycerol-3-phosphate dehydrogenase [Angustibacter sp.]